MIRQAFRGRNNEPHMESTNSPRQKKARKVKSKEKSMPKTVFDIKGIVHKEFVLAGQTANSAHHCDVLQRLRKIVGRLRPEIWRLKHWPLHQDNAHSHISFFNREFLNQTQHDYCLHPSHFSPLFRMKKKLKGLHFDTI
jgi:hypothetical protein